MLINDLSFKFSYKPNAWPGKARQYVSHNIYTHVAH